MGELVGSAQGPIESSAEVLWTEVSARLRHTVSETTFRMFFSAARPLELTDDAFVVSVQNEFTRGWIESHFLNLMDAAVRDTIGQARQVQLRIEAPEEKGRRPLPTRRPRTGRTTRA